MLSVNQLTKHYGDQTALKNINFTLAAGERVALLGANGSGKTTTINSICRLLEFDSGDIFFENKNIKKSPHYLQHIGAVLGGCRNTNWRLTARQNAEYFARLRGANKKQIKTVISQLEEKLGLAQYKNKEVGKLSTGNKQKAALLSALAYQPKLLLLDEPTLGLDMQTVTELQQIIVEQSNQLNQGFLITSHDMAFIDKICQRVIVIDQGQVIFEGNVAHLKKQLFHYQMVLLLNKNEQDLLNKHISHLWSVNTQIKHEEERIIINYDHPNQAFATINWLAEKNITPLDLQITPLSIETAYQSLLAKNITDSQKGA